MGKRNIIYLYQRLVENMGTRMCNLIHPEMLLGFNLRLRDRLPAGFVQCRRAGSTQGRKTLSQKFLNFKRIQ